MFHGHESSTCSFLGALTQRPRPRDSTGSPRSLHQCQLLPALKTQRVLHGHLSGCLRDASDFHLPKRTQGVVPLAFINESWDVFGGFFGLRCVCLLAEVSTASDESTHSSSSEVGKATKANERGTSGTGTTMTAYPSATTTSAAVEDFASSRSTVMISDDGCWYIWFENATDVASSAACLSWCYCCLLMVMLWNYVWVAATAVFSLCGTLRPPRGAVVLVATNAEKHRPTAVEGKTMIFFRYCPPLYLSPLSYPNNRPVKKIMRLMDAPSFGVCHPTTTAAARAEDRDPPRCPHPVRCCRQASPSGQPPGSTRCPPSHGPRVGALLGEITSSSRSGRSRSNNSGVIVFGLLLESAQQPWP